MKKILFIAALLGVGYYTFANKKTETQEQENPGFEPADETPIDGALPAFFAKYNGRVVDDVNGKYMLILDGRLYSPKSLETLIEWQKRNPLMAETLKVAEEIWTAQNVNDYYGGTF